MKAQKSAHRWLALVALLTLSACSIRSGAKGTGLGLDQLAASHRALAAREEEVFRRLSFTLAPAAMTRSMNFKLLLKDQLGRDWLFKAGESTGPRGATAVYRFFRLFGLHTPEIHVTTLDINGQPVRGTVQRFLPSDGTLRDWGAFNFSGLAPSAIEYMARNHAMSWLLANHQVHPRQFLILPAGPSGQPELTRIDNAVEWFLMGSDRLDIDWTTPILNDTPGSGYGIFWRSYLLSRLLRLGKIPARHAESLDAKLSSFEEFSPDRLLAWARLVAAFPEAPYREILDWAIEGNCAELANEPEAVVWKLATEARAANDCESFAGKAMARKRAFFDDLYRFHSRLASLHGESEPKAGGKEALESAADELRKAYERWDAELSADSAALDRLGPRPQIALRPVASYRAHEAVILLGKIKNQAPPRRRLLLHRAVGKLEKLLPEASTPEERTAIQNALGNLRALRACADDPRFPWSELVNVNRLFGKNWVTPPAACGVAGAE